MLFYQYGLLFNYFGDDMKKYKLIFIFLLLFFNLFILFSSSSMVNVVSVHFDQEFTFEKEVFFDYPNETFNESYNVRTPTNITGHYNGTYSFENDINGSEPEGWVSDNDIDTCSNISSNFNGHQNILNVSDYNNAGYSIIYNIFNGNYSYGIVEFWWSTNDSVKNSYVQFRNSTLIIAINLKIFNNLFYYYSDGWNSIGIVASNNVWYHNQIIFNCTSQYFDWYINGILVKDDGGFNNIVNFINVFYIQSLQGDNNYLSYYDAIGYSWDSYNATYSFNDEIDGIMDTSIEWVQNVDRDGLMTIENYFNNHYKIMKVETTLVSGGFNSIRWSDILNGSLEYWLYITDATDQTLLYILGDDGSTLNIQIINEFFQYRQFGGGFTNFANVMDNQWYHLRYQWYSNNTFDFYLNGVKELENKLLYVDMITGFDYIFSRVYGDPIYFDAIGYSWDSYYEIGDNFKHYSIGDNIVPYFETLTSNAIDFYEVDINQFKLDYYNGIAFQSFPVGSDNPSGWTDIENGQDNTNTIENPHRIDGDSVIKIFGSGTTYEGTGLEQNFSINEGNVNVSWNIDIITNHNEGCLFDTNVHSSDNSLVVSIRLDFFSDPSNSYFYLQYYNGTDYDNLLDDYITYEGNYSFSLFIDYSSDTSFFRFDKEYQFNSSFLLPLVNTNKNGLNDINFTSQAIFSAGNHNEIHLDNIGVYVNGRSIVRDFGYLDYNNIINVAQFYFTDYTYAQVIASSNDLGVSFISDDIIYEHIMPYIFNINVFTNDTLKGRHLLDFNFWESEKYVLLPGIRFFFTERTEIFNFTWNKPFMLDNSNEYLLDFDTSMDNTSYFYVCESGCLRFYHNVKYDSLEYIQATFDIINTNILNHSLQHSIFKKGISDGILRLNYSDDTSTLIYFKNYPVSGNLVLPDKVLNQFILLISDNDLYDNANTTGGIDTLILRYIPDWTLEIDTVSFLYALIPLIVIIVVSVLISQVLGKESFVALMLIMTILLFLVGYIPTWLTFITSISLVFLMFTKRKGDVS